MYTRLSVILIILHLLLCVLFHIGIELKILRLKRYMMPFVIFLPVTGPICCLILHFQLLFEKLKKSSPGIQALKRSRETEQNIPTGQTKADTEIIPLEEALIVNDAKMRRQLILNVLNDHPEKYMDVLAQARMNEDAEVVHYAATSMVEMSKRYDTQLRELEKKWNSHPDDEGILEEFCAFLKKYLQHRISEGKIEITRRELYSSLLEQMLKKQETLPLLTDLIENELNLKHYEHAWSLLTHMENRWPDEEECHMLFLRYYAEMGQGEKLREEIAHIDNKHIYIQQKNRRKLEYWRHTENEAKNDRRQEETLSL